MGSPPTLAFFAYLFAYFEYILCAHCASIKLTVGRRGYVTLSWNGHRETGQIDTVRHSSGVPTMTPQ